MITYWSVHRNSNRPSEKKSQQIAAYPLTKGVQWIRKREVHLLPISLFIVEQIKVLFRVYFMTFLKDALKPVGLLVAGNGVRIQECLMHTQTGGNDVVPHLENTHTKKKNVLVHRLRTRGQRVQAAPVTCCWRLQTPHWAPAPTVDLRLASLG
jgi:hypothetical protein